MIWYKIQQHNFRVMHNSPERERRRNQDYLSSQTLEQYFPTAITRDIFRVCISNPLQTISFAKYNKNKWLRKWNKKQSHTKYKSNILIIRFNSHETILSNYYKFFTTLPLSLVSRWTRNQSRSYSSLEGESFSGSNPVGITGWDWGGGWGLPGDTSWETFTCRNPSRPTDTVKLLRHQCLPCPPGWVLSWTWISFGERVSSLRVIFCNPEGECTGSSRLPGHFPSVIISFWSPQYNHLCGAGTHRTQRLSNMCVALRNALPSWPCRLSFQFTQL